MCDASHADTHTAVHASISDDDAHGSSDGTHTAALRVRSLRQRALAGSSSTDADAHGSSAAAGNGTVIMRRFVEFGSYERDLVWRPDLTIVNVYGKEAIHTAFMRLYEDGFVEVMDLKIAKLEMTHPDYKPFPFDRQHLAIVIESFSHSTKRIALRTFDAMTGLESALVPDWVAGWRYLSFGADVSERAPDYTHGSSCRADRISRCKQG